MKNIKGILTVLGLIALGFVGGFVTHRQVTIQQVQKVREIGQARGFQEHLLNFLEPTSEQRQQLEPIIQRYGRELGEKMIAHRMERKAIVDAMHEEMKPLLTDEQLQKLDAFSRRFRGRREKNGKLRRPRESRPEQTGVKN